MKSQEPKDKKFRQLSDEELEKVNGGVGSIVMAKQAFCNLSFGGCPVGEIYTYVDGKCQCVPMPNTFPKSR